MKHDPTSTGDELRLAALYQAHVASAEQPSAEADARILALAREAVAGESPARITAKPAAGGWRSWLGASWFRPGLAFATIASLSVVVVSLMPKEDMSVERAVMQAPSGPADAAPASMTADAAKTSVSSVPAPSVSAPAAPAPVAPTPTATAPVSSSGAEAVPSPAAPAPATAATSAAPERRAQQSPVGQSPAKLAQSSERARATQPAGGPVTAQSAAAGTGAAPATSAAAPDGAASATVARAAAPGTALRERAESAPARRADLPNPFPAPAPAMNDMAAKRSAPSAAVAPPPPPTPALRAAPAVSAEAGAAPRLEKPSLQSAPVESRLLPSQAIPEVRDSAPTYPNEVQSSIPLPYTYATPRAAARDTAPPTLAAAAPRRDPVEWVKAIQKLRAEGKAEQVLKELTEFRRQHPRYTLPDELKSLK